ncbi:uncharacterized protein LOC119632941 [Glossina fuscipes]|uniref:Uncharacterized protein LOC119632941 n=1 Tax=Glossina fuscipes TaxID=7396 RepID=A0A8U0W9S6_9MUSC|nr:uncharacterized protein LOC119632941 [Glossina fuscipes]
MSEVRRKKGPIYDVLIEELFEINCLYMAAMFSKLVAQEIRLMNGLIINYTLKEKPNLLLGLFDKFKAAELAYIQKKDQSIIFAQSCEALVLLEKSVRRYRWLLVEIYKIVLNLCEKVPSTSYKTNYEKCRIFYNYGMYVLTYEYDLMKAIHHLNRAMEMSLNEPWHVDDGYETLPMKEKICKTLSSKLANEGYELIATNPSDAQKIIRSVISCIALVGIEEHLGLFVQGLAMLIECLMADNKYEDAWEQLEFLSTYVNPNEDRQSQKNLCIYKYLKGILLMHYQKLKEAVEELTQAEKISVRQSFKTLQAHTLTQLGNVFSKMTCSYEAQRLYHRKAQKVYKEINEPLRAKGAFYKCIEAKMNEIFPTIKHTIKQSATVDVQMHRLRHWKLGCVHFWEDIPRMVKQDNGDKLLFLLEEI